MKAGNQPMIVVPFFGGVVMSESKSAALMNWILDQTLSSVPPFTPATTLAAAMQEKLPDATARQRAEKLILRESVKNFSAGFITGLGGPVTLPLAVPSSILSSWLLQARLVAAIAELGGHDLKDPRIRSLVLWALLGDAVKEVLKSAGVPLTNRLTAKFVVALPAGVFMAVQRKLGLVFLERSTRWGMNNLLKIVPVAGGAVAGTLDAVVLRRVGNTAVDWFIEP
jgi:hypothetical protein